MRKSWFLKSGMLVVLLTCFSGVAFAYEEKVKESIVYGLWSSPAGIFNSTVSSTSYDDSVNSLVFASLLKLDSAMNLVPDLAESYSVAEDFLSMEFKLQENLLWHDGTPLTAEDVAFTFTSMADPTYVGPRYGVVEKILGAPEYREGKRKVLEGIQIIDPRTIRFTFSQIYAPGLINLSIFPILPKHIWSDIPVGSWGTATQALHRAIGAGPYAMVEFKQDAFVKLTRNENYHGKLPKTSKFVFKVTNQNTAQVELLNGTLDIATVSDLRKRDIKNLEKEGLKLRTYPNRLFQYMGFNLRIPLFQDKRIRQAFMYGINRKLMVEKLLEGNGIVMNTVFIPSSWAYPGDSVFNDYAYDVSRAKVLLKEAGWEDRDGDGVLENASGKKFVVTLTFPTGNKTREKSAPIIQNQLQKIGVQVKLESLEFQSLMEKVVGNHNFELYLMGNIVHADPDPKPFWYSGAASDKKGVFAWNIAGFRSPKADELMDAGLSTLDIPTRKKIYLSFAKFMNEEVPWVYLYNQNVIMAYNKNLKNFVPSTYTAFLNVEDWYVEE